MIVPMEKITVLCLESDRSRTLDALRDLGVLHIVAVQPPAGSDIESLRHREADTEKALAVLSAYADGATSAQKAFEIGPSHAVETALRVSKRLSELHAQLAELAEEHASLQPFGHFDPDSARALASAGVAVGLYLAPSSRDIPATRGFSVHVLSERPEEVAFALIGPGPLPVLPRIRCIPIPGRSLADVERALASKRAEVDADTAELRALAGASPDTTRYLPDLRDRLAFAEAHAGMGTNGRIAYVRGFGPADSLPAIRETAARNGWAVRSEPPAPGENVPTLLRPPAWAKPAMPVFEMLGILPGYREADVSSVFLPFFSIFFAMLIGDAGYGLLFLALTLFLKFKLKNPPRNLLPLLATLACTTTVWGLLTGSFFFIQALPAPLAGLRLRWLGNEENLQAFCFLLGAVHLSIAHAWNLLLQIRTPQALAQAGWIGLCWTMYYAACFLVLGWSAPDWIGWLFGASVALVALFQTPLRDLKAQWSNHVMLPLSVIGNFGDIVSYLRLFLVGSASVTLILAFNDMAIGNGVSGLLPGLIAALIILAAHALNLVLGLLAVLVHGIRLNALEFSTHFGIQWTGLRFRPFARHA
jgi:V/A-type H+-transporting ATPase subunit I